MKKVVYFILMALSVGVFLLASPQIASAKNGTTPTSLRGRWYHNTRTEREVMVVKPHLIVYSTYKKHTNHKVRADNYLNRDRLYSAYAGKGYWEVGLKESDAVSDFKPMKYHGKKILYQHLGFFGYGHRHIIWHHF